MYNFPPTFNYVTQSALLLNFFNTLEVSSIHFYYSSAAGENKAIVIATVVTRHDPFIVNIILLMVSITISTSSGYLLW